MIVLDASNAMNADLDVRMVSTAWLDMDPEPVASISKGAAMLLVMEVAGALMVVGVAVKLSPHTTTLPDDRNTANAVSERYMLTTSVNRLLDKLDTPPPVYGLPQLYTLPSALRAKKAPAFPITSTTPDDSADAYSDGNEPP
jgi:hypothetical protein